MFLRRLRFRAVLFAFLLLLAATAAVAVGGLLGYLDELPPIEQLEYYSPAESTMVYDHGGRSALAEFTQKKRYVIPIRQMPDRLINAFLAIEDKRYYDHFGVDLVRIIGAALRNLSSGGRPQGASTITMQLAGSVLPEEVDRREISYARKIKEALYALQIERRYSKEQILEFYLNQIPFVYNSYGVEAAAKTYFGKTVQDLTLSECAIIAGMPKGPSLYNPISNPSKCRQRRNQVLKAMLDADYITRDEYEKAKDEQIRAQSYTKSIAPYKAPYFVDYLRDSLLARSDFVPANLRDKVKPATYLDTGGFKLISTLDLPLQNIAEKAMKDGLKNAEKTWHLGKAARHANDPADQGPPAAGADRLATIVSRGSDSIVVVIEDWRGAIPLPKHLPFYDPDRILREGELIDVIVESVDAARRRFTGSMMPTNKLKGAMVVLEAKTGKALALVGGDDFYDTEENKAQWNFATQGGRQPGSGVKPMFYAAAIESGFQANQMFLNVPFDIGDYRGRNYNPEHEGRMMTLQEGLERSQNVMMLRVFHALGYRRGVQFVRDFDFSAPQARWSIPDGQASVCLGTFDVSPLELACAYLPFANQGIGIRPYAVEKVLNRAEETVFELSPFKKKILSPQQAYIMARMMMGVVGPRGTAYYGIGQEWEERKDIPEVAGKTGTTSRCNEAWFTGYTPDLVISVFVGFDPPRSLGWKVTGGMLSGPIFREFLEGALKTRKDWQMKFTVPGGIVQKDICLRSGLLAGQWCRYGDSDGSSHAMMPFIQGTEPKQVCNGLH